MKVSNVLELSLANSIAPELRARRREDILRLSNPAKRAGALALHELAVRYPRVTSKLIGRDIAGKGLSYVGAGADSIVYRKADTVIKVNHGSVHMTEADRQRLAEQRQHEHDVLKNFLAPFIVGQSIAVDQHPVVTNQRAVQIMQPYCDISDLRIFPEFPDPQVDCSRLEAACAAYPGIDDALRDFVAASRDMYEATGLIPDTSGKANVVMNHQDTSELVIIDGQPLGRAHEAIQHNILAQLDSLERGLQEVA